MPSQEVDAPWDWAVRAVNQALEGQHAALYGFAAWPNPEAISRRHLSGTPSASLADSHPLTPGHEADELGR